MISSTARKRSIGSRTMRYSLWSWKNTTLTTGWLMSIRSLYDETARAALLDGSAGDFFRMTVGVQQGCPLSSVLYNVSGKDNAEDFDTSAAVTSWPIKLQNHLSILLYGCESWKLTVGHDRKIKTCEKKLMIQEYTSHHTKNTKQTNMYGRRSISWTDVWNFYYCQPLQLSWFGHVYHNDTLPKNHITRNSRW